MGGFFHKLKAAGTGSSKSDNGASTKNKKEEPPLDLTPVERLLHNAGPVREDGSDKFFGLENFGNTCYCNSIVQALYHSDHFREHVVNYPLPSPWDEPNRAGTKVNVTIRPPPTQANGNVGLPAKSRPSFGGGQLVPGMASLRPEDRPEAPEYKKKHAMIKGPVLELAQTDADPYGMQECTFTGLKDIFTALIDSQSRTGVLSPQRFLDIFKRDNEMFRNSMHQDAHEFYGIVLNDVIANVETNARRMHKLAESRRTNGVDQPLEAISPMGGPAVGNRIPGTGWVHDIFEGVLTSETRCLACERASQRDETFLDLSIDLEEHSSVTSCLQKFSAEEMLCERNKFHCDHCGGLQEAEKRMKIKKLPKVLALHLKRFKYTEDYSRLQKLFHRVVYPYHLRMFNTTDDVEDPDRLYELYAVVVHIGGNAYHGHYVAVIKTKDRGWLLFDDEMVEPVDKHFVRNFFGDKPGMACAYVLFYQETTFEQVRKEMDAEGLDEVKLAAETAVLATTIQVNGASPATLPTLNTQPLPSVNENDTHVTLNHSKSNPGFISSPMDQLPPPLALSQVQSLATPLPPAVMTSSDPATTVPQKSKEEMAREKKELKAQEKARKTAEKEQLRLAAKERHETQNRLRETARLEREQHHKAMHDSKQLAAEEEKRHKKETADAAGLDVGSDHSHSHNHNHNHSHNHSHGHGHGHGHGFLNRAGRTSKSMTRKSFAFLNGKADKDRAAGDHSDKTDRSEASDTRSDQAMVSGSSTASESDPHLAATTVPPPHQNGHATNGGKHIQLPPIPPIPPAAAAAAGPAQLRSDRDKPPLKERFSFGLGKRKSSRFFSGS